jgi:hypothetical protein
MDDGEFISEEREHVAMPWEEIESLRTRFYDQVWDVRRMTP